MATAAALESVLRTHELNTRPSRLPDYQTENHALLAIAQHMADSPQTTLQKLVEVALEVCRAGSAGVSLVSEKSGDFYWPAIAGAWKPNIGGGTPRHFGPGGVVLDRNAVQLFTHPERCYPYLALVAPPIEEALLTPFYVAGKAVGTVWVVAHDPDRKFDAEDLRLIESLGRFAAALYPLSTALDALGKQDHVIRDVNESLVLSSLRLHELTEQAQGVAETLQSIFLPRALPHDDKVRFDASYSAAQKDTLIGGDWLEAAHLPDGRYLISIGDVTGHGLNASIIAGRLRQAITDYAFTNDNPASVLSKANRILRFQHPDVYATAVVGFVDRDCTRLTYASAGHPAPLLATSHTVPAKVLPLGGVLLGYGDELDSVSHSIEISPGSVLAFYTDGITEFARDIDSAETALRAAVAEVVGDTSIARPAVVIQNKVLGDAPPTDDIALLIVQFDAVDKAALRAGPTDFTKTLRFHSSDASAARTCRREMMNFIRHFAADQDALFTAELIIGEILANTVQHAPGPVEVNIDWSGEKPIVRVVDTGPGLIHLRAQGPQDMMNEHGRGLFLIRTLADDVSIASPNGSGTELRAVLPLLRNSAPSAFGANTVAD
jgi:anti-sigma regulatory factor (Ser/Thr protein kinase)